MPIVKKGLGDNYLVNVLAIKHSIEARTIKGIRVVCQQTT
jgi:hypothetical protein